MIEPEASYVLLTDAPPLIEGGHGCSVLAWNWLRAMEANLKLVVTHRRMPQLELSAISEGNSAPFVFYPDLARFRGAARCGWLKFLVELALFCLASRRIAKAIKASSAERIFAFFGGDPWFLLVVKILASRTGLPLDVYLVDDLEESCRLNGQPFLARCARWLEPRILRRAERVFVISSGYVQHMRAKYGIHAEWLPIPFRDQKLVYRPYKPENPDIRTVAYIGAVNALYLSALKEFLDAAAEWNKTGASFKLKILLLTYSSPAWLEKELAASSDWEIRYRVSTDERKRTMEQCWAVFLPYSFEESVRVMVSTSFPSRLSECMTAGRPLLVYGPPYATLPCYFLHNRLSLCVQSKSDLKTALGQIDRFDSMATMREYQAVLEKYHSAHAIRSVLMNRVRRD